MVGKAQRIGGGLGDLAQDAHTEARARERVAVHHLGGQAEFEADAAHFVFEQLAQRLDQLQLHVLGQATDVVVALDDMRLAGLGAGGLDDIRVDGALREELDALASISGSELPRFLVEHLDEQSADDLALGLGVADALELAEEALGNIDADHAHT